MNSAMSASQLTKIVEIFDGKDKGDDDQEEYFIKMEITKKEQKKQFDQELDAELFENQDEFFTPSPEVRDSQKQAPLEA